MDVLETVIDCNGKPETVVTIQKEGESTADFIERHRQAVAAKMDECGSSPPPVEMIISQWITATGEMAFESPQSEGRPVHDRKLAEMKAAFPPLTA